MTTAQATAEGFATRLERTLPELRDRIDRAVAAAGRRPSSVRVVAVTKAHPLQAIEAAVAAGLTDIGENRVHELQEKVASHGGAGVTWHIIGHVQGRKARLACELADLIHSVDSRRLAERISRIGEEDGRRIAILCQVNTSGEESKSGFDPVQALEQVHEIAELPGLRVDGLMTMAPFVDEEAVLGAAFARLRDIHERLGRSGSDVGPELSMGMTNDLEIAIREGSTMVRVGTALFGARTGSLR